MRNKATKKNMDLDLRRYGRNLYTKAEKSGGSGSDEGGGGGDVTPSGIVGFPYQPATLVGWVPQFVDNDYTPGYRRNSDDVTILMEPILPENLEEYVNTRISESTEETVEIFLLPIFEYDENMDVCARSYQDYQENPPESYGGIPIVIYHQKSKNSTFVYSGVQLEDWKGIYNGKEYIIGIAESG